MTKRRHYDPQNYIWISDSLQRVFCLHNTMKENSDWDSNGLFADFMLPIYPS
jgi:hypothetical protein